MDIAWWTILHYECNGGARYLRSSATQQNKFIRLFYFLFVNWAAQMSAGQTSPKKSNIKSYKFLTFFIA